MEIKKENLKITGQNQAPQPDILPTGAAMEQIPPTPTIPPVPPTEPTKKTNWPLIAGVVLLIAVLAGGGVFAYQNYFVKRQTQPTPTPTTSQAPNGDLANWKTYTNTRYGFSLKHPSDWKVLGLVRGEGTEPASETSFGIVTMPQVQNEKARYLIALQVEVDTPENLARGDYKTWLINTRNNQFFKITNESVPMPIIAGREVTVLEGTFTENNITTYHKNYLFQSPDSKNFYSVTTTNNQEQANKATFDQILSTFKFLGKDETASWKTYTNTVYSLKYPTNFSLNDYREGQYSGIQLVYIGPMQASSGKTETSLIDGASIKTLILLDITKPLKDYVSERRAIDMQNLPNVGGTQSGSSSIISEIQGISLGDKSGYMYSIESDGKTSVYFIQNQQVVLQVVTRVSGSTQNMVRYDQSVGQILSTFKFTFTDNRSNGTICQKDIDCGNGFFCLATNCVKSCYTNQDCEKAGQCEVIEFFSGTDNNSIVSKKGCR